MLIFTRKVGEAVIIGNDVKITVLHVKGSQIRLGIDAPSTVTVHREEIFSRIQNSNLSQAVPIAPSLSPALSAPSMTFSYLNSVESIESNSAGES